MEDNWKYLSPYFSAMFLYFIWFIFGTCIGCKTNILAAIFWWLILAVPILVAIAVYNLIVRYVLMGVGLLIIIYAAYNGIVAIIFHAMAENAKIIVSVIIGIIVTWSAINWNAIHAVISKH